nr:MAG TPA: hypothetical protein [Crassvirales sp.]
MFEIKQLEFEDNTYPTDAKYFGKELIRYGLYLKNDENKKKVFYIKNNSMEYV